jgi:polyphosphate kinase
MRRRGSLEPRPKTIPYKKIGRDRGKLPKRSHNGSYNDQASLRGMKFVEERY